MLILQILKSAYITNTFGKILIKYVDFMVFKRTFNLFNTKGVQGPVNITAKEIHLQLMV